MSRLIINEHRAVCIFLEYEYIEEIEEHEIRNKEKIKEEIKLWL